MSTRILLIIMKIVHVSIASPWGDIYAYQENLLPHYHRKMGHEVTIIAPIYSRVNDNTIEPVGESYLEDGSKLLRLAPIIKSKAIMSHLHIVKGLANAIDKEKADLVFVHDVGSFDYLCLKRIKRNKPKLRIVFANHADLVNSLHTPFSVFLHKVIYKNLLIPQLVKIADWFYGVPNEKIKLLLMGADDGKMKIGQRDEIRLDIRNRYCIDKDDFLIVTGGKIDLLKNIHVLAHAINDLGRPNVQLLVFGTINKEMKPYFDAESSLNVLTIGWVNSNQVYEYFYAADLVVFPGLHSVLWEQAVASRVPCAFSKIEGFEHVQVNGNCILMEGKDSDYYKIMIKELIDAPLTYMELRTSCESPLLEAFNYSKIAQQVLDDVKL